MPKQSGKNFEIYAGESLPIDVTVLDPEGDEVSNLSSAILTYKRGSATAATKTGTINGAVISFSFSESDTLALSGTYDYEVRVKDASNLVFVAATGKMVVNVGLKTNAM